MKENGHIKDRRIIKEQKNAQNPIIIEKKKYNEAISI